MKIDSRGSSRFLSIITYRFAVNLETLSTYNWIFFHIEVRAEIGRCTVRQWKYRFVWSRLKKYLRVGAILLAFPGLRAYNRRNFPVNFLSPTNRRNLEVNAPLLGCVSRNSRREAANAISKLLEENFTVLRFSRTRPSRTVNLTPLCRDFPPSTRKVKTFKDCFETLTNRFLRKSLQRVVFSFRVRAQLLNIAIYTYVLWK